MSVTLLSRFFALSFVAITSCSAHVDYIKTIKLPTDVIDTVARQPGAPGLLRQRKPIRVSPGKCLRSQYVKGIQHHYIDSTTGTPRSYRGMGHSRCVHWSKPIYHGLGRTRLQPEALHRSLQPVAAYLDVEAPEANRINQLRYDEADSLLALQSALISLGIIGAGGGMIGGGFLAEDRATKEVLWIAGGAVGFVGLLTGLILGLVSSPDHRPPGIDSHLHGCITAWNCAVRPTEDCPD